MKDLLLIAALAGCGSPHVAQGRDAATPIVDAPIDTGTTDLNQSGTRIKVKAWTTADGAKLAIPGFAFDSQRNEECGFRLAADGMTRCLPITVPVNSSYFADAACSQPVAVVSSCGTPPSYVEMQAAPTCPDTGAAMYTAGQVLTTAYFNSGGTCTSFSNASFVYLTIGAAVDPSAFALGTVTTQP